MSRNDAAMKIKKQAENEQRQDSSEQKRRDKRAEIEKKLDNYAFWVAYKQDLITYLGFRHFPKSITLIQPQIAECDKILARLKEDLLLEWTSPGPYRRKARKSLDEADAPNDRASSIDPREKEFMERIKYKSR